MVSITKLHKIRNPGVDICVAPLTTTSSVPIANILLPVSMNRPYRDLNSKRINDFIRKHNDGSIELELDTSNWALDVSSE